MHGFATLTPKSTLWFIDYVYYSLLVQFVCTSINNSACNYQRGLRKGHRVQTKPVRAFMNLLNYVIGLQCLHRLKKNVNFVNVSWSN